MSINLGINVIEVDGRVSPSIQPAPTSVTGFIVQAQRGVPGEVVRVSNWSQFLERFGSFMRGDVYGACAVRGFFDNGGNIAYVTRVVDTEGAAGGAAGAGEAAATASRSFGDLTVTAGWRGRPDPGEWGNGLAVEVANLMEDRFDLIVHRDRAGGTDEVERWEGLGMNDAVERINDEDTGSSYIRVSVIGDGPSPPAATHPTHLNDGLDGRFASAEDAGTAFAAAVDLFRLHPIQLLCCPESSDDGLVRAALSHCELMGDRMFVGHVPEDARTLGQVQTYSASLRSDKRYGALYFPWARVADPLGGRKSIPPTGHILGVYARTEQERGIWKAPAGNAARLRGVLDVTGHVTDADHTLMVIEASVNAVRFIPGQGIVIDSSRTLSTNSIWLHVSTRLLFNFLKSSLKAGLRWTVQEPNDETLWNKIKYNTVTPFLMGLWRRGAFGSGAAEDLFSVKVDAENNPPADRQQGRLNIELYVYPVRPAETIVIRVGQQEAGATATES